MLKIGLTGGIGCGKSTVTALFAELAVPVIDADHISRELVVPGEPALVLIARAFGGDVINADGSLSRAKLRDIIFTDGQAKQTLEAIMHPLIYQSIQDKLGRLDAAYCLIVIPLLFETEMTGLVDRVLVVDCPVEQQIRRVQERDKVTMEQIQAIIDSQVSRAVRLARADDVIDNTQTMDKLAEQVKKLHNLYILLSHYQD